MNFLIHGASNLGSTNLGDFLYADQMYNLLAMGGRNRVSYYQASPFFESFTENYTREKISLKDADWLIYFPGGYFSQPKNSNVKDSVIRFFRYMIFGLRGLLFKKPIAVIGIGCGNFESIIIKKIVGLLVNYSKIVTCRNNVSYKTIKSLIKSGGVKNYGDMLLSYPVRDKMRYTNRIDDVLRRTNGRKIVLVHYNHSHEAMEKFAYALKEIYRCIKDFEKYYVVVTEDSVEAFADTLFLEFKNFFGIDCLHFKYSDPFESLCLILKSDIILTCKLHLGVIGCMAEKRVLCFAIDYDKTKCFYDEIGFSDHCYDINNMRVKDIINVVKKISSENVVISGRLYLESTKHRKLLISTLK